MSLKQLEERLLEDPAVKQGYEHPQAAVRMGMLLRELRNSLDITQRELERRSGIPQPEISRYEAGNGPRGITITQLEKIAHAQGLEVVIGFVEARTTEAEQADGIQIDGHKVLAHTIF